MSALLDGIKQRLTGAIKQTQSEQDQIVEATRQQIGQEDYEEAKRQVKLTEPTIQTYASFAAELRLLETQAGTSLTMSVRGWLAECEQICATILPQLRDGIAQYKGLSFRQLVWKDGLSVDEINTPGLVGRSDASFDRTMACSHGCAI